MRKERRFGFISELNESADLWEFTNRFGDRSLRLLLHIACVLDQPESRLKYSRYYPRFLSRKIRMNKSTIIKAIHWMLEKEWLAAEEIDLTKWPTIIVRGKFRW